MKYETFNPEIHDVHKVAQLVYDVDFRTFDTFFKDSSSAVDAIYKMLLNEDSETFLVILNDSNEIIGILIYYINKYSKHFYWKSLRLLIVDILDSFVLCDVKKGDLYIAELAVDSSMRGQGIGRKVLNQTIEWAEKKNFNRVTLDADFRNTGARKLYERIGFKVFNKKRVKFLSFERGMYNMELNLK